MAGGCDSRVRGDARDVAHTIASTSPPGPALGRLVGLVIMAVLLASGQDPRKPDEPSTQDPPPTARSTPDAEPPRPPVDADPLVPVPDPPTVSVPRDDLPWRAGPVSPLEGVWRLQRVVREGGQEYGPPQASGYLSFGRDHLFVHLQLVPSVRVGTARPATGSFLQAGVHSWRLDGEMLTTSVLAGHRTDGRASSRVRLDRPGDVDRRRIRLLGSVLRVSQSAGEFLEFARVE